MQLIDDPAVSADVQAARERLEEKTVIIDNYGRTMSVLELLQKAGKSCSNVC